VAAKVTGRMVEEWGFEYKLFSWPSNTTKQEEFHMQINFG